MLSVAKHLPRVASDSVQSAVDEATLRLTGTITHTPRLDAELLMCLVLSWSRARLFAHWDKQLSKDECAHLMRLVERRAGGEPVAYIRGIKEFLGLEFHVDPRVLIPRPETELLVARAVAWLENKKLRNEPNALIVDVGTGSGAIAVGIGKSVPSVRLIATDNSQDALDVARLNADRHQVRLDLRQGSLLEPIAGPIDLVVANLPYLSRAEYESLLGTSIAYEPRGALTDEADGLHLFDRLLSHISGKLAPDSCILLEIGSGQPAALQRLARDRLPAFQATVFADYAGLPRVLQLIPSPAATGEG